MKNRSHHTRVGKMLMAVIAMIAVTIASAAAQEKSRLFVTTDIGGDPDDQMSMVRLMLYSNQIDIEGLANNRSGQRARIESIVEAYGEVRDNLLVHEPGYPTVEALMATLGESRDMDLDEAANTEPTPGVQRLIDAVDRDDSRPLWVSIWGGPNMLGQALWRVRAERSPEEVAEFVSKLRVYAISDQDPTGPVIRENFPDLFYVVTPGANAGGGFHHATWIAIGGDKFHGRFGGADFELVTNEWLDRNVRNHGPLGKVYPHWEYMMEGDTPSYLHLVQNGLNVPERPDWGGWGGRYELYTPRTEKWFYQPETRPIWTNVQDEVLGNDGEWHTTNHATIWRWREAYQNDFAGRMDWTVKSEYEDANHPPVVKLDHPAYIKAKPRERVDLSATATTDPDGDPLSFHWFCYEEPGTRRMSNSRSGDKHDISWASISPRRGSRSRRAASCHPGRGRCISSSPSPTTAARD